MPGLPHRLTVAAFCFLVFASSSTGRSEGIQQWRTPDGKLYFGDYPPAGSTLVGRTESLGTSGGGDVQDSERATPRFEPGDGPPTEGAALERPAPPERGSDAPVNAGVSLAKRNRLYFDTWSQRGLSANELEVVERNLNAVRNDVGRDLRVDPDARFEVVLTEPEVFHRYSGTRGQVTGLFDGKIHIPIPTGIPESELQGTLWHEYSHAVVHSKTDRCPVWLNEGIAVHQQSKIDPSRRRNLKTILRSGDKLPYDWEELDRMLRSRTASHEDQDLAYRQALAVVDFLYDRYSGRRVNDLLVELRTAPDIDAAIREIMHTTLAKIERDVVEYLKGK